MELMRIRVAAVRVHRRHRFAVARVSATSARKVSGRPVARIDLRVTFKVARGEPVRTTRQRARETALDYLDVS